ncbi:MAG: exo-beta-N-acetylmuramidase NamZ domain-containing protein, partial [Polyangiales bacterium]
MVQTGLDRIASDDSDAVRLIRDRRVGLLAHAASVDRQLRPATQVISGAGGQVVALFGPEHGFTGAAQDMIGV